MNLDEERREEIENICGDLLKVSTVQYIAVQYSGVQYSAVQYSTVQYVQ